MKPAYLICGDDEHKLTAAMHRLRERAEREGAGGALEELGSDAGTPDPDALIGSIPAMSLVAEHRYLLVDGVERWNAAQQGKVADALASLPPDLTVVLVARDGKEPKKLSEAVEGAGGEVLSYAAPKAKELPARLVAGARERGFLLDAAAARTLVERMGARPERLHNELDRLALWAGEGGSVAADDLAAMVADDSEEVAWALCDAIVERRPADAVAIAERLTDQGEGVTGLIRAAAGRLRKARQAVEGLEAGRPAREVESSLKMHPYAAKMLVRSVRGVSSSDLAEATAALADLEYWTRGGSDYSERVALTLAVRTAAGGASGS